MQVNTPRDLSQRGRISFLFRDSVIYGGAAALSKSLSLVTFPIIARHFSAENYGVIDLFGVLATFLGLLLVFGQDSAVARYFYEYEDLKKRQQIISQSFFLQLLISLALVIALLFFAHPVSKILTDIPGGETYLIIVILQAPFFVLMNFSQNLLKWTFQRRRFLIISVGSVCFGVIFVVIGLILFDFGVMGFLLIGLSNYAIFGLLGLWFAREWLVIPTSLEYLREMVRFALPLGIICCAGAFFPLLERWLTADLLGLEKLGFLAAGARIAMLVSLLVGAFQTAWGPFSLSLFKQPDAIDTYNLVLKGCALMMPLMALLLAAVAFPLIMLLAGERYSAGALVVFPLSMALAIQATGWVTEIGIGISKRSYAHLYGYFFYASVTIIAIIHLAPIFEIAGVAVAIMLGHSARTLISSWLAQRLYPMKWSYLPVLLYYLAALVLGGFSFALFYGASPIVGSIGYLISVVLLSALGVPTLFSKNERASALFFIKERLCKMDSQSKWSLRH